MFEFVLAFFLADAAVTDITVESLAPDESIINKNKLRMVFGMGYTLVGMIILLSLGLVI